METVAERAGISVSHLSRIETTKREPTLTMVNQIANALNVPAPLVVFLASDEDDLKGIDKESERRFSDLALSLIRQS